ncbi:DUF4386 domain-containing protein [Aquimarina algiphila]|uniref:DUF4386 domain-containing protein n=1 Tax=Aquimarina algiphila TaxID=2047982 RepID=UPI00232EE5B4|nr:DUF4386 domain-containing protein [Aquimarina algiphila]
MESHKKIGKIAGGLFLLMIITGATGNSLRGLSLSLIASQNFFNQVLEDLIQMKIAILLDLIASGIGVYIGIILFSILKQYNKKIAIGYVSVLVVGFTITVMSNITHLSFISLCQELAKGIALDENYLRVLSLLKVEEYYWAHFLILTTFSLGASILYYALFKTKLIPRFLSIWGLIAVILVFSVSMLQVFDYTVNFIFYAQNGVYLLFFSIWLMVKGFNPSAIITKSAT